MTIILVPGFHANIQIKDKEDKILYQKFCHTPNEVSDFIQQNGKRKSGWSLLRGVVTPLRTQNLKDFAKDFFLPTFVNYSLKIDNLALKIIASTFAIALDVITSPLRLLTTPFRIYYNRQHPEAEHAIINLIQGADLSQKAMADNVVNLCYEVQSTVMGNPSAPDEEGNSFQHATRTLVRGNMQVALKRMPGGIKNNSSEVQEVTDYLGMNSEWTIENSSKNTSSLYRLQC